MNGFRCIIRVVAFVNTFHACVPFVPLIRDMSTTRVSGAKDLLTAAAAAAAATATATSTAAATAAIVSDCHLPPLWPPQKRTRDRVRPEDKNRMRHSEHKRNVFQRPGVDFLNMLNTQ